MLQKLKSLKELNTFGFEVRASVFYDLQQADQLKSLWKTNLLALNSPLVLGGGSNILFTKDYAGLILKNSLKGRTVTAETKSGVTVEIAAGENWHQTVLWSLKQGWGGMENLSLIPGSVGAAPIQNIGAYGVELKNIFHSLTAFNMQTGKTEIFSKADCRFGYRDSIFKNEARGKYVICGVKLNLSKNPVLNLDYGDIQSVLERRGTTKPGISDVSSAVIEIRRSKLPDPAVLGNCGSFFKNPVITQGQFEELKMHFPDIKSFRAGENQVKVPAAWLIETAGFKGLRRGDAGVHEKQALVLINYGNAKGAEIKDLALDIKSTVFEKFGIALELEVNIL